MKFDGMVLEVLTRIFKDLIHDITEKARKEPVKYKKVLNKMSKMKKDYSEKLVLNAKAEGEARGIAKGKAEERLTIAQALGMSLAQLEDAIQKNTPLES